MKPRTATVHLLLVLSFVASAAGAHGAATPPDYLTRVLHDCNDDWGGHAAVNDGHDLIALDVQEAYNGTLGEDTLLFRFVLNAGYNSDSTKPELKEVLTFKAGAASVSKEVKTSDNQKFTGTFDAVQGPSPFLGENGQPDGARFTVTGLLRLSGLGLQIGDKVSSFSVQGFAGLQKADQMPGGYTTAGQTFADCSTVAPEQSDPESYARNEYALRGATYYGELSLGTSSAAVKPDGNATILFTLKNPLKEAQAFTVVATAPPGIRTIFHTDHYSEGSTRTTVGAQAEVVGHFYAVAAQGAQSGDIRLKTTTDLGGHAEAQIPLTVQSGATSPSASDPGTQTSQAKGGSPGVEAPTVLALLALAFAVVRRR